MRSTERSPTALFTLLAIVAILAGCAPPKAPPIVIERPATPPPATDTLAGTMYLGAGPLDFSAVPVTPALQRSERIPIPPKDFTAWLVTVENRSTRGILLNPRYDEWKVETSTGATAQATPATRLRLRWFMDTLSKSALERIDYPHAIAKGATASFPIYVPITGKYRLVSMRFWSRDFEDSVDLVDPASLPFPVQIGARARIESLRGEGRVIVGLDKVENALEVGGVIRPGDVLVLEPDTVLEVRDEWSEGPSYEIHGPGRFVVIPPPDPE